MLQNMRSAAKYVWILLIIFFVGGFLLVETSGLLGRATVTTGTAVGSVNGDDITYVEWQNAAQQLAQGEEARTGRALGADDMQRMEDQAFEQLVTERLLRQELRHRGIDVTDDEIRQAAQYSPPPQFLQSPELQTDGRFDPEKYQRFLSSPAAKAQGILYQLELYYRQEIPRQKLFERIANDVYVTDAELWRGWQDTHDSVQVAFVALPASELPDSAVKVSDAEVKAFYDKHRSGFTRPGRAVISLVSLPRVVGPADSAAALARAEQVRQEVVGGASFADVAKRESADSASAVDGGLLGTNTLEGFNFIPEFTTAARSLATGQISAPVLSPFGYHIIKVDERKGDTLTLRHILIPIHQSDSSAVATDRRADSLANAVANSDRPARFDSVAKSMGLPVTQHTVLQGNSLIVDGRYVPDVSSWAFGGALPGESSDLISSDDGYYVARLDSLEHGGIPALPVVRDAIRAQLAREKKVQLLLPRAKELSASAASSTLESAAQSMGLPLRETEMFTRVSGAPGLGSASKAVGAAFGLPVGAVSAPIATDDAAIVLRVDRRVSADSAAWVAQKPLQRRQVEIGFQRQRVQQFLANLREQANVKDRRAEVRAAGRRGAEG